MSTPRAYVGVQLRPHNGAGAVTVITHCEETDVTVTVGDRTLHAGNSCVSRVVMLYGTPVTAEVADGLRRHLALVTRVCEGETHEGTTPLRELIATERAAVLAAGGASDTLDVAEWMLPTEES